jgi:hypothetical protein
MLVSVHREHERLQAAWVTRAPTIVQGLLSNDAYYVGKGCGSTKQFFEEYLK